MSDDFETLRDGLAAISAEEQVLLDQLADALRDAGRLEALDPVDVDAVWARIRSSLSVPGDELSDPGGAR